MKKAMVLGLFIALLSFPSCKIFEFLAPSHYDSTMVNNIRFERAKDSTVAMNVVNDSIRNYSDYAVQIDSILIRIQSYINYDSTRKHNAAMLSSLRSWMRNITFYKNDFMKHGTYNLTQATLMYKAFDQSSDAELRRELSYKK